MLAATLQDVDEAALLAMCREKRPETDSLEWKRKLPDASDKDKQELAKDVSALANLNGGDLVYGVEAIAGQADVLMPITTESSDAAKLRLTHVLDGLVDPRISGIEMHAIEISSGGYVLGVRVPASFEGPHSVRVNERRRFVLRNPSGTSDMTFDQLRGAFGRAAALRDQARSFVTERLRLIRLGQAPVRIPQDTPLAVLHVIPLAGLADRHTWDLLPLFRSAGCYELLTVSLSWSKRLNLDGGVAYHSSADGVSNAYAQAFRNGCVESVILAGRAASERSGEADHRLFNAHIVSHVRLGLAKAVTKQKEAGFSGPAIVAVAIIRARNFRLARESIYLEDHEPASADEQGDLVVPAAWIDHLETADADVVARPLLDTLWQAFDVERCPYFDETTGAYRAPR